ncbi:DUF2357 domain-containing protein [Methanobrevibacter sp. UBA417]|jgi:hypothetical protein|uniref:DUF2357 domain-containing protein n=1 Tax=Methanobrevibacter sp. UBA417 TaxID=1915487 RepID=UPI0039B96CD3
MLSQKIKINLKSIGINGEIILTYSSNDYENIPHNPQNLNKIVECENIPIYQEIKEYPPIIILEKEGNKNLMLLEERNYEIIFKTLDNLKGYEIFFSLKENKNEIYQKINTYNPKIEIGRLNFQAYIGKTFIDIKKDSKIIYSLPLEIRSYKIDYNQDYANMIGDLSQISVGTIFDIKSPLFQNFNPLDKDNLTITEKYMLIEYLFKTENLPSTVEYINWHLYKKLIKYEEPLPLNKSQKIKPKDLIKAYTTSKNLIKLTKNDKNQVWEKTNYCIPEIIINTTYKDTINTNENRFYKYFLKLIENMITTCLEGAPKGYIKEQLTQFNKQINEYLSNKKLKEIGELTQLPLNSQVLQKKEGYRKILEYYFMLELSYHMNWDEISKDIKGYQKKIYELYEKWCYIEILNILSQITNEKINYQKIFKINKNHKDWSIELKTSQSSKKPNYIFQYSPEIQIYLFYQKNYTNNSKNQFTSYSNHFKPDYSILIKNKNKENLYHFDAKYKMDKNQVKKEDINKMHTYMDAIINTKGSYILYVGKKQQIYKKPGKTIPSVGAFPLNPGTYKEQNENQLKKFILKLLKNIQ